MLIIPLSTVSRCVVVDFSSVLKASIIPSWTAMMLPLAPVLAKAKVLSWHANRHWMIVVWLQRRRIASSTRLCVLDSRLASHGVERSLMLAMSCRTANLLRD